jgi:hypothetical protein
LPFRPTPSPPHLVASYRSPFRTHHHRHAHACHRRHRARAHLHQPSPTRALRALATRSKFQHLQLRVAPRCADDVAPREVPLRIAAVFSQTQAVIEPTRAHPVAVAARRFRNLNEACNTANKRAGLGSSSPLGPWCGGPWHRHGLHDGGATRRHALDAARQARNGCQPCVGALRRAAERVCFESLRAVCARPQHSSPPSISPESRAPTSKYHHAPFAAHLHPPTHPPTTSPPTPPRPPPIPTASPTQLHNHHRCHRRHNHHRRPLLADSLAHPLSPPPHQPHPPLPPRPHARAPAAPSRAARAGPTAGPMRSGAASRPSERARRGRPPATPPRPMAWARRPRRLCGRPRRAR